MGKAWIGSSALTLLGISAGGALGSILRYLIQSQSVYWLGDEFPYGTLIVNIIGSFLIGFLFVTLSDRYFVSVEVRFMIMAGFLGGFTTFSAFSLETLKLMQQGSFLSAVSNVFLSVAACIAACYLGVVLARNL